MASAARVRDAGLAAAGRSGRRHLQQEGLHPADPAVPGPLPLLHFRHHARAGCPRPTCRRTRSSRSPARAPNSAARKRCSPSATSRRTGGRAAREWLDAHGYDSTLGYLRAMAIRVLEETGLLPHLNPGVLRWEDFQRLKPVAPSMGMMLETTSRALFDEPGGAHFGSPDKDPDVRLRVIEDAGRCTVAVHHRHPGRHRRDACRTGSTRSSRLRRLARQYGHSRRCSIQGFRAKPDTAMRSSDDLDADELLAAIAVTRLVLGPGGAGAVAAEPGRARRRRPAAGRRRRRLRRRQPADAGPRQPRAPLAAARRAERRGAPTPGSRLTRAAHRPPAVPRRAVARPAAARATSPPSSTRRPGWPARRPSRQGWSGRSPTAAWTSSRPHRPRHRHRHRGPAHRDAQRLRLRLRRLGFARRLAAGRRPRGSAAPAMAPRERMRPEYAAALREAEARGPAMSDAAALVLFDPEPGAEIDALAALADEVRRERVGDVVHYVVNRNINFTNVCYTGCRFCAFAQRRTDADAYSLSLDEVGEPRRAGLGGRRDRGLHAGRHPSRPARHGLLRPRRRGEAPAAGDARARVQPDGGRQRRLPHRHVDPRLAGRGQGGRASTRSPAPRPRSSTTTCAGS